MRIRLHTCSVVFVFSLAAASTLGQTGSSSQFKSAQPNRHLPYTAEFKITSVRVLADGTTITRESSETRAFDSQNRRLTSTTLTILAGEQNTVVTNGHVDDPVEGTQINWNSQTKTAKVFRLPSLDQRHGCWVSESGQIHIGFSEATPPPTTSPNRAVGSGASAAVPLQPRPAQDIPTTVQDTPRSAQETLTTQNLGVATIQGMEVHGHRVTNVVPAGQLGNDKPIVRSNEAWLTQGIEFPLRSIDEDPQTGKSTTELVKIDLSEPPITTFQPPDDFKVTADELHQVACPEPGMPWQ